MRFCTTPCPSAGPCAQKHPKRDYTQSSTRIDVISMVWPWPSGLLLCATTSAPPSSHTSSNVISGNLEAQPVAPAFSCQFFLPYLGLRYWKGPCIGPSSWTSHHGCRHLGRQAGRQANGTSVGRLYVWTTKVLGRAPKDLVAWQSRLHLSPCFNIHLQPQ